MSKKRRKAKLSEVVGVLPGFQSRSSIEPNPNGERRLLQLRDLNKSKTELLDKSLIRFSPGKSRSETLQAADVLFLFKGHKPFAIHLPTVPPDTTPSGYFFILRPKTSELLPAYLSWVLNQKEALTYFQRMSAGTAIPVISRRTLQGLPLSIPPLESQETIVEISALDHRRRDLLSELSAKKSLLATTACLLATQS